MRPDTDATVKQIDSLLEQLSAADPASRAMAEELIRTLMQLYGAGLERILEILREASATDMAARLADDKLVGSLLLLHGLHPVDPETRVREGLRRLERRLESHHLVLESIQEGVARIRVERNGNGAPPASLAENIERMVADCAPDLAGVEIEGLVTSSLVQIAPMAG